MRRALGVLLVGVLLGLVCHEAEHLQALFGRAHGGDADALLKQTVLAGLVKAVDTSSKDDTKLPKVICLGYNTNLDLRVDITQVVAGLSLTPPASGDKVHDRINTREDLSETIAYFLSRGSAAERFVADKKLFDEIVRVASSAKDITFATGGNAALMANRLASEGCKVLLGGAVGSRLAQLLHPNINVTATQLNTKGESTQKEDEVHLILEYPRGASWGPYSSPRDNRLILVHDITNSELRPLEAFHKAALGFDCQIVVIAGLHLLEGQPFEFRTRRLHDVVAAIHTIPDHIPVHLELASVGDVVFLKEIADIVLTEVDSLGLNEQEMGSLYIALGGADAKDFPLFVAPDVDIVVKAVDFVLNYTHKKTTAGKQRLLGRIHFHFLHYHLVANHKCKDKLICWKNGRASVAAGSLVSTRQACDNDRVQLDKVAIRLKGQTLADDVHVDPTTVFTEWTSDHARYYLAPVLVCNNPTKTVGLGDAISSMGLLHATFSRDT